MKTRLLCITLMLMQLSVCCQDVNPLSAQNGQYLPIWQDTLVGLIDTEGRIVLPCQYEDLNHPNKAQYILVKKGGLWGAVDIMGRSILPCRYEQLREMPQTSYFLAYSEEDGYHVVDITDSIVLRFPPACINVTVRSDYVFDDYDDAPEAYNMFSYAVGELAPTITASRPGTTKGPRREGLYAVDGTELLPPVYRDIRLQEYIIIEDTLCRYALLDYQGRQLFVRGQQAPTSSRPWEPILNTHRYSYDIYRPFSRDERLDPVIIVEDRLRELKGVYSIDGQELLPIAYRAINLYSCPPCLLLQDSLGLWSMVDQSFQKLTPSCYRSIWNSGDIDYSDMNVAIKQDGQVEFIWKDGTITPIAIDIPADTSWFLSNFPIVEIDSVMRLIGPDGRLLPGRYKGTSDYHNDRFYGVANEEGQWGVIDRTGRTVVPFEYESTDVDYDGSIYARCPSGKVIVFDSTGRRKFTCYGVYNNGKYYQAANRKGLVALVDKQSGRRCSRYYEQIEPMSSGCYQVRKSMYPEASDRDKRAKNLVGYLAPDGHEIYPCILPVDDINYQKEYSYDLSIDCTCGELEISYDLPYRKKGKMKKK